MERRLVAILCTDVVGYFTLMGEYEAGTLDYLRSLLWVVQLEDSE